MHEIYKKSKTDNLSSADQLDKAIVIVSPSFWLVMVALVVIIAAVFVWALFGTMHQIVSTNGIFMNREGIHSVYSDVSGTVDTINIDKGDYVKRGDVIAKLYIRDNGKTLEQYIYSTLEGEVTELSVVEGRLLTIGDLVARVALGNQNDSIVVCYVPVEDARRIQVGMEASIYPSNVNKREYGYMKGEVEYVDNYVTSRDEISNQVGVNSLVDAFLKDGPVVEVRLKLKKDESTTSGYWWSGEKGKKIEMVNGTMVSADIVIEEESPLSLIVQ